MAVSHEVYCAYYEEYNHEKYLDKRGKKREISFDLLQEQGNLIHFVGLSVSSLDYQMIEKERLNQLYKALKQLDDDERWLIGQLYFYEYTEKEVAEILGVSRQAINKRKQKILKRLGDILR